MKPIAVFVLVGCVALFTVAASAKTGTAPGTTDERAIAHVAGPPAAAKQKLVTQAPGKAELKKAKVKQKPPLHDPN